MNILVSPLDWGLGHASRTVAIIRVLLSRGHNVFLAGSGNSLLMLMAEFPRLTVISLPSFSPTFTKSDKQWMHIGRQVPTFLFSILREHRATQRIVRQYDIDMIISDNRYGVRSRLCRSYIVTHQLRIHVAEEFPERLERIATRIIHHWLRKFNMVLVPDVATDGTGLAGDLSMPIDNRLKTKTLGIVSRLAHIEGEKLPKVNWLGIVSGPEPQRTIFENLLKEKFSTKRGLCVIVCGQPNGGFSDRIDGNCHLISHCDARRLAGLISSASRIVCRSGYSTIMDLELMQRKALLVPTPGQAEQEYLAQHLLQRSYSTVTQKELRQTELKE